MPGELRPGSKVRTTDGAVVSVKKLLGEGGQGWVYLVDWNGKNAALKWYKPDGLGADPEQFRTNIKKNVEMKAPDPAFLWPLAITEWQDGTFGYVMDLRPDGYYDLSEFMLRKVVFKSYRTVIDAALKTVSAYRKLHNRGYSYLDLNDGNLFINPQTGDVRICDNDNAAPENTYIGVMGKPRYMAPEVVTGASLPNTKTDRYSLALLLYRMFCLDHPLEGKRYLTPVLTQEKQIQLYGTEPIFIMDPDDHRNGPDPAAHRNTIKVWACLPDHMRAMFLRAFGQKGLLNPNSRPTEMDWVNELTRFRSEIVPCQCGNDVFTQNGEPCACERCHRMTPITHKLELEYVHYSIPAIIGSRVYRCQMGVCGAEDALKPVAMVVQKKDTGALMVKNLSGKRWSAFTTTGEARHVAADELIPLRGGIRFSVYDGSVAIRKIKV